MLLLLRAVWGIPIHISTKVCSQVNYWRCFSTYHSKPNPSFIYISYSIFTFFIFLICVITYIFFLSISTLIAK
jgi:hypothetical protein